MEREQLRPGQRVRIVQEIDRREGNWHAEVTGTILEVLTQPTGSWFAHGKHGKLWLNRLRLEKPDGEITTLVVDPHTRIEVL